MLDAYGFTEKLIMLDESHFELAAGVNKKISEQFDQRSLHSERATLRCDLALFGRRTYVAVSSEQYHKR
jgi:hypothetical protein